MPWIFALIGIDQLIKILTLNLDPMSYAHGYPYYGIGVFKDFYGVEFSLVHAANTGAAWSMFSDWPKALLAVRILLIAMLGTLLFRNKLPERLPWVLIFSGALSNVIDYFLYGHVIDMFHFVLWGYDYPVFNMADSLIFSGAVLLLFGKRSARAPVH